MSLYILEGSTAGNVNVIIGKLTLGHTCIAAVVYMHTPCMVTLRVETAIWQDFTPEWDRRDQIRPQDRLTSFLFLSVKGIHRASALDEKLTMFICSCVPMCSPIRTSAHSLFEFPVPSTHITIKLMRLIISEVKDFFVCVAGTQFSTLSSQTTWLKVKSNCNHCNGHGLKPALKQKEKKRLSRQRKLSLHQLRKRRHRRH
eukprot:1160048-Pelagomonas_calceolata.AAC.1